MRRKPVFETMLQQLSGSVSTLVVIVIGAATLYFFYRKGRGTRRPPPPPASRTEARDATRSATSQRSRASGNDDSIASMISNNKFTGSKICVVWDVFYADGNWKEDGLAKKVLQWYAFSCDAYVMCRIKDAHDKTVILEALRGVEGLQRHKILFCTTQKGYEAFTRQISPSLLVTNDQAQASFLSGVLPYIVLIGSGEVAKPNVLCSSSVQALECPSMDAQ